MASAWLQCDGNGPTPKTNIIDLYVSSLFSSVSLYFVSFRLNFPMCNTHVRMRAWIINLTHKNSGTCFHFQTISVVPNEQPRKYKKCNIRCLTTLLLRCVKYIKWHKMKCIVDCECSSSNKRFVHSPIRLIKFAVALMAIRCSVFNFPHFAWYKTFPT